MPAHTKIAEMEATDKRLTLTLESHRNSLISWFRLKVKYLDDKLPCNLVLWNTTFIITSALNAQFSFSSCWKSLSGGSTVSHEVINPGGQCCISRWSAAIRSWQKGAGAIVLATAPAKICVKAERKSDLGAKMGVLVQHQQQQSSVLVKEELVVNNTCKRACLPAPLYFTVQRIVRRLFVCFARINSRHADWAMRPPTCFDGGECLQLCLLHILIVDYYAKPLSVLLNKWAVSSG